MYGPPPSFPLAIQPFLLPFQTSLLRANRDPIPRPLASPRATTMNQQHLNLDPHPKPESTAQDPNPNSKPDPDPKNADNHQHTPNGSDSQTMAAGDHLQQPNLMGSGRKSVHWSPDLVTESHASQNIVNEDRDVSLDGSNPYISSSPVQSSSQFSFKGMIAFRICIL